MRKCCLYLRQAKLSPSRELYASLGNSRTFSVERAFMTHTFHVAFVSPIGSKRKYCFSMPDEETKRRWGSRLERQMVAIRSARIQATTVLQQIRQAAEGVALQVLRDAVIPREDNTSDRPITKLVRSGSVSLAYPAQGGLNEMDLGPLTASNGGGSNERLSGMMEVQTGKELVLLCRQNSLLPGLLELLQAGMGVRDSVTHEEAKTDAKGKMESDRSRSAMGSSRARVAGGRV